MSDRLAESSHAPPRPAAKPAVNPLFALSAMQIVAQALRTAVQLGIADHLDQSPTSVDTLAERAGVDARSLRRLLRALTPFGIFAEPEPGHFALNVLARQLRSDAPGNVRDIILGMGTPLMNRLWSHAAYSIRTGRSASDEAFGTSLFECLASDPAEARLFDANMASLTEKATDTLLRSVDLSDRAMVVDVGGGVGRLLAAILRQYPTTRGALLETPQVIRGAREYLASQYLLERCELVAGDFLRAVPVRADTYILKNVLHDWPDEQAVVILRNCRQSLAEGGKVLIIELIVEQDERASYVRIMDLNMLVVCGGVERTEAEFRELCAAAGLRVTRITRAFPQSVIEATSA